MGIEGFYKTLEKKNDEKIGIIKNFTNETNAEYFYIDFNSILHNISITIDSDLAYILACIIYENPNKRINDETCYKIANKWNYELKDATIETYISYFTPEIIDRYTIEYVKEHIMRLLSTYIKSDHLKKIFISIDGIPNMAKIIEQKQRKYMIYVRNSLVKKIFDKYVTQGNLSEERIIFEKTRIKFDRGKIVPWSLFMKKLEESLIDKEWIDSIKSQYPNLEEFALSGSAYPGEGEKKIMENIIEDINNEVNGNYMLYSPDADMILLSIILNNVCYIKNEKYINNFNVLHYDQETKTHSFININKFSRYICSFIVETANKEIKITDELIFNITNDFVIIATVFGNDFVPRIDSINVRIDFADILELYKNMIDENTIKNIVIPPEDIKKPFRINYENLLEYLSYVAGIEDDLIRQKFIINNFNTSTIKKMMGNKSANENEMYEYVKKYINEYGNFVKELITNQDVADIIEKYIINNKQFLEKLVAFEIKKSKSIGKSVKEVSTEIANNILKKYKETQRISRPFFSIHKSRKGSLQKFHIQKYLEDPVNKLINDKEGDLTDYDKDIILLDWKIGEYAEMLNSLITENEDINFGNVTLDFKKFKLYLPAINRDYYYESYLGIEPHESERKKYILREYLFGLIWTFDFYFNKNNARSNLLHVSTWFYPLHKAPLLKEIVQSLQYFVKKNKVNIFSDKIKRNLTNRDKFLNRYEQLLYTVPKNRISPIIKGYEKLLENEDLFPDMEKYVDKIWNTDTSSEYIDCRRVTFITKCILKKVHNYPFNEFMSFVEPYRHFLNKSGLNFGYVTNIIKRTYNKQMLGGALIEEENIIQLLKYYRNTYKKLYLETKYINYKYIYKEAKKHLNSLC